MRHLKFKDIQRFYEIIWPNAVISIASGAVIDESHISIDQTWIICNWADLYGFDSKYQREKVNSYLASFGLEPKKMLKIHDLMELHGDRFSSIREGVKAVYGWGTDYSSDQANWMPAPTIVPIASTRNDAVIDICISALTRSGVVNDSDFYELSRYRLILAEAFSHYLAVLWWPADVMYALEDLKGELDLSEVTLPSNFLNDVLDLMGRSHSAEVGVNWESLKKCIEEILGI